MPTKKNFYCDMKLNRIMVLNWLRLGLIVIILAHYFCHISHLFNFFETDMKPRAQNCFWFARVGSAEGDCYIVDFLHFYSGGLLNKERIEKNLPLDVYNSFLLTQTIERVIAPMRPIGTYCFQYPPMFFALITPLAYFDLYTAWRLWFFILAICVVITYIVIAYDSLADRPLLLCGLFIFITSFPVSENFFLGQTTPIEAVILALSFRLLIKKNYFWSGLIAGASLLKLQHCLIILIPGFCVGKKDFLRGFLITLGVELLLAIIAVGFDNIWHFIRIIYVAEITHSIKDLDDIWYYFTFTGMLECLPWFISSAAKIGQVVFVFICLIVLGAWLKIYPTLHKISNQSMQLIASITTIAFVTFNVHGCWYDYLLFIFPCFWLYIWSTTNESEYSGRQSIIRLIISLIVFTLPFLFWDNLAMKASENTITGYQLRYFLISMLLLSSGMIALLLEFKRYRNKPLLEK